MPKKKLLLIDSAVTASNPAMKSWLQAFPAIVENFDEIEVWSTECTIANHPKVRWRPFKKWKNYTVRVKLYDLQVVRRFKANQKNIDENTVVQITGFHNINADINYVHFSNSIFQQICKNKSDIMRLPIYKRVLQLLSSKKELKILNTRNSLKRLWVVSQKLGEELAYLSVDDVDLRILANSYDNKRFNLEVREEYREQYRKKYGFNEEDIVLVFSSLSHFERKGLYEGIEAVFRACEQGAPYKLLILGGTARDIEKCNRIIKDNQYRNNIKIGGLVENIERHLSAADGLLFPSHFEAFSLAEIEAAAMGLRLYLTKHYGTEMILDEAINGCYLPWDIQGMADVLVHEWKNEKFKDIKISMGKALNQKEFSSYICELYRGVLKSKFS